MREGCETALIIVKIPINIFFSLFTAIRDKYFPFQAFFLFVEEINKNLRIALTKCLRFKFDTKLGGVYPEIEKSKCAEDFSA